MRRYGSAELGGRRCSRHLLARRLDTREPTFTTKRMRITLDIPDDRIAEATARLGFQSRTDAVIVALRELIRRRRLDELKARWNHDRRGRPRPFPPTSRSPATHAFAMKVLVEPSVWVDDFRGRSASAATNLAALLDFGTIAAEHGCPIGSLDADFARLADLGFVELHQVGR